MMAYWPRPAASAIRYPHPRLSETLTFLKKSLALVRSGADSIKHPHVRRCRLGHRYPLFEERSIRDIQLLIHCAHFFQDHGLQPM